MKTSLRVKLAVAAGSALFSTLAAYFIWTWAQHDPRGPLDLRWVDPLPTTAGATPTRASGFRARPLTEAEVQRLIPDTSPLHQRDPLCYYRYRADARYEINFTEYPGGKIRAATNHHGLRGRSDVRVDRPELRVLVLGDSHTDGVCDPDEAHPALLRERLIARGRDVETLNAAVAGYSFHHYVGALERYLPLAPDVVVVAIYGGNDFQESLLLQHLFAGTSLPSDEPQYRARVARANDVSDAAVGQGMLALRYFTDHPEQIEIGLGAARDACAEIVALCREHGARPMFVYIPPAFDVAWKHHAKVLDAVARELELPKESLNIVDSLADRCLDELRLLTDDVVDMRTTFRALDESPYWSLDLHINLEGQRKVAEALLPLVERSFPPGFDRAARAPRPEDVAPTDVAPEIGAAWRLEIDATPITLPTFDEQASERIFAPLAHQKSDPIVGSIDVEDSARGVGSDGAWPEDTRRSAERARVWILGDELIGAGGASLERLGAALETLGVVCVDASTVGHGPGNYLGVLANRSDAPPSVCVVVWNSANDFTDALELHKALEARSGAKAPSIHARATPQDVAQRWTKRPREARVAAEISLRFAAELRRRTEALGARLVIVIARPNAGMTRAETRGGLDVLDRVATAFSSALSDAGFEVIDECDRQHAGGPAAFDAATGAFTLDARAKLAASIAEALRR